MNTPNMPRLIEAIQADLERVHTAVERVHSATQGVRESLVDLDNATDDARASLAGVRAMMGGQADE